MKKSWNGIVMALCVFLIATGCGKDKEGANAPALQEFSATMVNTSAGQKVTTKIYMKAGKLRTDTSGSSTINRQDLNKVWTIIAAQKSYMEMEMEGATATQPQMVEETVKGEVSRKELGSETVSGHPATKYEVTAKADDRVTKIHQWWATDIKFPVRTAAVDGSWSVEYRDIQIGDQPDSLFEIPSGYSKMSIPGMPGGMSIKIPGMEGK